MSNMPILVQASPYYYGTPYWYGDFFDTVLVGSRDLL